MLFNTSLTLLIASNLGYAPTFSFAETNKHIHFNLLNSKMLFSFSSLYRGGSQVQCNFQLDSFSHFLESPLIFEYDVIYNQIPAGNSIISDTYEYNSYYNIEIVDCIFDQCYSSTSGGCIKYSILTANLFNMKRCTFYQCVSDEHAAILAMTTTAWREVDMKMENLCFKNCYTNMDSAANYEAVVLFMVFISISKVFDLKTSSFLNCQKPQQTTRYGPLLCIYSNNFALNGINFSKNIYPDSSNIVFNRYLRVSDKYVSYCQFENLKGLYLLQLLDIEDGGSLTFHNNNIIDFNLDSVNSLPAAIFVCNPSSSSKFKIENNNFHNLSVKNAIFALSNFIYLNNSGIYPGMSGNYVDSTTSVLTGTAGFILTDSLEYHLIPELDADRCNYPPIIDTPTPTEEEIIITPTEEEIIVTPTEEEIIITPTEEEIIVTPTEEEIIITPTEEEVIITPTEEEIIITPTEEEIIVTPTEEEIIITPTEEEVIITPTEEEIIITPTEEEIIITPTEEEIIITPTDDIAVTTILEESISNDMKESKSENFLSSENVMNPSESNNDPITSNSEEGEIHTTWHIIDIPTIIPSETNNHEIVTEENIKTKNQEETIDEEETINEEKTFQETIEEETSSHQDPNEGSGEEESKKNKISGGGIAGIIIGVLLLIAIIIFLVIFFMRRRNEDNTVEEHELDDETYETTAQTPQLAVGTSLTNSMFVTQEGMLSLESRISDDPFRIDIEEDVYSYVI